MKVLCLLFCLLLLFLLLLQLFLLRQDNFTFSDEYTTAEGVYEAIADVEENHIVTHENDRAWRDAVVMNKPSLLALRSPPSQLHV